MRRGDRYTRKFYGNRNIELYPVDRIYEEAAFIGYYFHWQHDEIMQMSHGDRVRWCKEISKINSKLNDTPKNAFEI